MKENKTKTLMVANWKMNPHSPEQALELFTSLKKTASQYKHITTIVCPSAVHLGLFYKKTTQNFLLGASGGDVEDTGAKTGLVSLEQYKKMNVSHVILGHSEQRSRGLSSHDVSEQIFVALKKGLTPILCVGESSRDEKGQYIFAIVNQLKESLANIPQAKISKLIVAYEPLWAVGSKAKRGASVAEVEEVAILIRRTIADMYDMKRAPQNPILYGGSVSEGSFVSKLVELGAVQGFLMGRASLSATSFKPLLDAVGK